MRIFIAILPTQPFADSLRAAQKVLIQNALKGSFTKADNLHMTLAFIGETASVRKVIGALDMVECKPFTITLSACGSFTRKGGDICWAGVQSSTQLTMLQNQIMGLLADINIRLDDKPFHPHITLGRQVVIPEGFSLQSVPLEQSTMTVFKISLMNSENIDGSLRYTEIHSKDL